MKLNSFTQTPNERKRYIADYSEWLLSGETIVSVLASIDNVTTPPLVVDDTDIVTSDTAVLYYASEGKDAEQYIVSLKITTSLEEIKEDYVIYNVRAIQ